jgi:lysophospholipase L1-like esterase
MSTSVFERYPRATLWIVLSLLFLAMVAAFETAGRVLWGLGNPVIYDMNPLYGYRPLPDQHLKRSSGAIMHFNNLGLRAAHDWLDDATHKVLFLGDSVTYGGSYISNDQLFSHLSVAEALPTYEAGNAGVNGWGVLNVLGLVRDAHFLPADTVITVLPEGDFLRGFNRIAGQPFWSRKPHSALEEIWYFLLYTLNLKKFNNPAHTITELERQQVIEQAASALKNLDELLNSKGIRHLIYITPSRPQALAQEEKDTLVLAALDQVQLHVHYLLDNIEQIPLNDRAQLYVDNIHLSQAGHRVWGHWIAQDLAKI